MKYINLLPLLLIVAFVATSFKPVTTPEPVPLVTTSAATKVDWKTWNEGFPLAEKNNTIILVDVYTDWCGWCKRMDRDTYGNSEIAKLINKDFVAIKFNPEHKDVKYKIGENELTGPELLGMLGNNQRYGFPTTFFLFPTERKIHVEVGYKSPEAFKEILERTVSMRSELDKN